MSEYYLPFQQGNKIAEFGGGEIPQFHPNYDIRQLPGVDKVVDFNKRLDIESESFHGIFSKYMLEHLSFRRLRPFLREVFRILKPKGIAVFITADLLEQCRTFVNAPKLDDSYISMIFGGQRQTEFKDEETIDDVWDSNSHHCGFSHQYITDILTKIGFVNIKIYHILTDKGPTDMIIECSKPDIQITDAIYKDIKTDNMLKLNIGSFTVMSKGWTNIDILDMSQYAIQNGFEFKQLDATKELPYQDNTVDSIIASHFMEHITRQEGLEFLKQSFRVLKYSGIIRLTVPDTRIICQDYLSGNISRHSSHNEGVKNAEDDSESLFHLLIAGHKTLYDYASLSKQLEKAGFLDIKKQEYQKSYSKEIETETRDMYPELSLYIEAVKPNINYNPDIQTSVQTGPIITKGKLPEYIIPEYIKYDDKSIPIKQNEKKKYKFSIVYPTYRPGSMDLLFTSLSKQTYKNFELLLVDDYLPRTNNKQELYNKLPEKEIPEYLKYHDSPKPDCFNKFYRFGTTVNTGIIEAIKSDSDFIIFLQDYTYLPPDQLEKWNEEFNKNPNCIITGTATILYTSAPTKWNDIFSIWEKDITDSILKLDSEDDILKLFRYHSRWIPTEYEGFYTGIPKSIMIKLNGLDENIDYPCEQANDFFERAKIAGHKLIVNKELNCLMMDHHDWHSPDLKTDYLWHIVRYEYLRKDKAPRIVPLEEYIQQVKDGKRSTKANNCFDLEQINQKTQSIRQSITPILIENAYAERIKFQVENVIKDISNSDNRKILNIGSADCYPFNSDSILDLNLDILHIDTVDQVPDSLKPKVKFQIMDAHKLPFKDKEFNVSLLGDTLEHIRDPVQVLREAKRVAKNVYITIPNEFNWDKSLNPFQNPGHVRHYDYNSLIRDLDEGLGKNSYTIEQYDGGGWSFWTVSYESKMETDYNISRKKKLNVALISTPFFGCPPSGYGGLEAIVWDLAEGLDKLGHTVTLFAPEGSKKPEHGYLITTGPALDTVNIDWFQAEKNNYEIYKQHITSDKFDLVDGHDWFGFEYLLKLRDPKLKVTHQHHGGLNWDLPPPVPKANLVALSKFMQNYSIQFFKQKGYDIGCQYNYNGIDLDFYKYDPSIKRTNRLLYVGRFSKFKGPHYAIELAKRVNIPIDLIGAAKFIDDPNYLKEIESMCDNDKIIMYKDVTNEFKLRKMQEAKALIFPSRMNEPFGLCLLPDSPILTFERGVQKIKDIKIGDNVLTHKGRFMRVSQIIKREYSGDMIKITPHKLRIPIILTPEHPVLAIKTELCDSNKSFTQNYRKKCRPGTQCYYMYDGKKYKRCKYVSGEEPWRKYKTEWIEAKYLQIGDMVTYPIANEIEKDIKKIRILDYIDDFLNVTGDCKEDNSNQTDLFGGFIEKTVAMQNKGGTGYESSKLPAEIELTDDLMRLFGYYIAEGCTKGDRQIEFSFSVNEIEYINDVTKLMKDIFGLEAEHIIEYHDIQTHNLRYSNRILSSMFQNLFAPKEYIIKKGKGSKANIVRIPPEFLNLPLKKLAELIKGIWRGDGLKGTKGTVGYGFGITSETLAHQLVYLLTKFDILSSIRMDDSRTRQNKNWSRQYKIEIFGNSVYIFDKITLEKHQFRNVEIGQSRYIKGKNLYFIPIDHIDIIEYNGDVWNLEVENDNSYVSTIIVHNCAIEAMATGSPVIAFDDGAIKEIITNDTGFVCNTVDDMVCAINKIDTIKPENCRKRAEFFSKENMAKNKEKLYYDILNGDEW